MSRAFCYKCHRSKVACLCGRIEKQPNQVKIIVLQHPDEANNKKATAIIAELGLQQYQRWVGEDFTEHRELSALLDENQGRVAVLFPSESALPIMAQINESGAKNPNVRERIKCLLVLDGTWRKAKKMWQLNPQLHKLMVVSFDEEQVSQYRIRKEPEAGYLSTVESIVFALRALEADRSGYQALLDLFAEMVDFQINKMGKDIYQRNYQKK